MRRPARVPEDLEEAPKPLGERLPPNFWKLVEYLLLIGLVVALGVFVFD